MLYDKESSNGFPTRSRGGVGVIAIRVTSKTGSVVDALSVDSGDQVIASTRKGMVIRCPINTVSEQGRIASGVKLITLEEGDEVVAVARLAESDLADRNPTPQTPAGEPERGKDDSPGTGGGVIPSG